MGEAASPAHPPTPPDHRGRAGWIAGAAVGVVLAAGAYGYWRYLEFYPRTEDAFLQAHYTWVAPQVTGQVVEKFVHPNQFVRAGQPLFKIDPRPYQDRLDAALANQVLVNQQIAADLQHIESLGDLIKQQDSMISLTQQRYARLQPLLTEEYASQIEGIKLQDTLSAQQAKLDSLKADLQQAITALGAPEVQAARRQEAAAAVALAQLDLEWTSVPAPADGWVTQFDLRVGDVVRAAQPLFPFIEAGHWWIQANFKETRLHRIREGQPVNFTVDMYPGQSFAGTVHSLSRGVAASFSLLPPENTTGNWVKVTQRVPVRILVEEREGFPFRLGASVEARVDTTAETAPPAN